MKKPIISFGLYTLWCDEKVIQVYAMSVEDAFNQARLKGLTPIDYYKEED